ncbi:MAG: ribonuclease P protein component [Opitutus sp.]
MRFRTEQHLRRQSDFRAVRENGRRINCGAFTLTFLNRQLTPNESAPAIQVSSEIKRAGFVASNASVGHAVIRNRAKRRLREIFRLNQAVVPVGCDLVLTARTATTIWPFEQVEQKFVEACRQISPKAPA